MGKKASKVVAGALRSNMRECDGQPIAKGSANSTMAYLGYVLSMPPCKMAQKTHGCPECQHRSCMGLAERNVRLYLSGTISEQRLAELSQDLAETCPLASCYQSWLFMHMNELPVGRARGIKNTRQERRDAVQEWLRMSCSSAS